MSPIAATGVALTERDRQILHACWSLGAAPAHVLHALISPDVKTGTFRDRLRKLQHAGHLHTQRFVAPNGRLWLYSLGAADMHPHEARPWRPGLAQLSHTIDVGTAIVALTRTGFALPRQVTGWKGEGEIRAWAEPGDPYPDAVITWQHTDQTTGSWPVELDRATESRATWRRKLVRYLSTPATDPILALTTTDARAINLAKIATEVGVPLLATTLHSIRTQLDPIVLDTRSRRRLPLSRS